MQPKNPAVGALGGHFGRPYNTNKSPGDNFQPVLRTSVGQHGGGGGSGSLQVQRSTTQPHSGTPGDACGGCGGCGGLQAQRSTTQQHSGTPGNARGGCGGRGGLQAQRSITQQHSGAHGVGGGHGSRGPCRYGAGCANDNCMFIHHQNGRPGQRPCKFGIECSTYQCEFAHPCAYGTGCRHPATCFKLHYPV